MRTIRKIIIEGFQSHERTEMELHPGLNVIVGESDQGKSAIIRALRWVLYNEPRGQEFIRFGENNCSVTVQMDDGTTIIRERTRSGSKNRYVLRLPGEDARVFEGFGNEIPWEVVQAHGMYKVAFDEDKEAILNLGSQLEGPFLLSETGTLKAKAIGRLCGVHILDAAGNGVVRDLQHQQQEEKRLKEELQKIDADLEQYRNLPELEKIIKRINFILAEIAECQEKILRLTDLQQRYVELVDKIEKTSQVLNKLDHLESAEKLLMHAELLYEKCKKYLQLEQKLTFIRTKLDRANNVLTKLEILTKLEKIVEQTDGKLQLLQKSRDWEERFTNIVCRIKVNHKLLNRLKEVDYCSRLVMETEEKFALIDKLSTLKVKSANLRVKRRAAELILKRTEHLQQIDGIVGKIILLAQKIPPLEVLSQRLAKLNNAITAKRRELKEIEQKLEESLKKYKVELETIGKCPLCFATIGHDVIERVIKEYTKRGN